MQLHVFGLFAAVSTLAMSVPAAAQVEVDEAMLERDLTILAADDMEGREAGTRGHERAAGYVAGRMAAMGLEPAGGDGTYFQQVTTRRYQPVEGGNSLEIAGIGALEFGEHFVLSGGPQVESGTIKAPLVFIGYGNDLPGQDDFAGVDLEGAIAVRIYGGASTTPGMSEEQAEHYRSMVAQRVSDRGAVGLLLLQTPRLAQVFNWDRLVQLATRRSPMTWVGPDGNADMTGPGLLATGSLSANLGRQLLEGRDFDYADLIAAEARGERIPSFAMRRMATITFASEFTDVETPNVIGLIPGSDPELADEYVLLTAHLDHVGIQPTPKVGDDEIYNGALDNAVGVTSMLEVARLLRRDPPRRSVLVIGLTAEEQGLVGSSYNAANPTVPAGQVVANVNLDMPIITYPFSDVVAFGAERSSLYPVVVAAAEEYGLEITPDPQPEQSFFTRSDQYSYVLAGIPAVYLDLGFGNGGEEAQGIVLTQHYHEPSDEIDLIDWQALHRFTGVNYLIARDVANMDERPRWNPGDFFGETFGRRPEVIAGE